MQRSAFAVLSSACGEYVLAVKGPGQVLGELSVAMGSGPSSYAYSARAREDSVVIRLSEEALMGALLQVRRGARGEVQGERERGVEREGPSAQRGI